MIRKFNIEDEIVFRTLQENISVIATVKSLTHQTYEKAFATRQKYNISYWDSLVISSALEIFRFLNTLDLCGLRTTIRGHSFHSRCSQKQCPLSSRL